MKCFWIIVKIKTYGTHTTVEQIRIANSDGKCTFYDESQEFDDLNQRNEIDPFVIGCLMWVWYDQPKNEVAQSKQIFERTKQIFCVFVRETGDFLNYWIKFSINSHFVNDSLVFVNFWKVQCRFLFQCVATTHFTTKYK